MSPRIAPTYALLASLMLGAVAVPAQANPATYAAINTALKAVEAQGYQQIDEIDVGARGNIKIDAIGSDNVEHKFIFDANGALQNQRSGGIERDLSDRMDLTTARKVLDWLAQQGYTEVDDVSADDGLIEIDARNAHGEKTEFKLDPQDMRIVSYDD
ncbi:PepSY domain-containing protein [Sinimarinibacterium sp. NLF-5-8]|uniref:PepSY domain-containing protein n=1 Tax=Sinimarinibacterium sp. NLF-5-8 TaxID=2698684 RepID=UPI00137BD87C|nr:PepSY domain-containing protein [Sinimarinibacterium sp. NLF-5-8]QHS11142.1 PepSY domain-containing protein [Sinimarinibacterium sp. NLF-5-8]